MGGIAGESPQAGDAAIDAVEHLIEDVDEALDLGIGGGMLFEPVAELIGSDFACDLDQVGQGLDRAAGHQ